MPLCAAVRCCLLFCATVFCCMLLYVDVHCCCVLYAVFVSAVFLSVVSSDDLQHACFKTY